MVNREHTHRHQLETVQNVIPIEQYEQKVRVRVNVLIC